MRVIIAGSRGITKLSTIERAIKESEFNITTVVSGTARGVDRLGEEWAAKNNVKVARFPAEWDKYGKSAGYKRNAVMSENADALIAIRLDNSKGTTHMIHIANKKGLLVYVLELSS